MLLHSLIPQLRERLRCQQQQQLLAEELSDAGPDCTITRSSSEWLQAMVARFAHGPRELVGSPLALSANHAGHDLRGGGCGYHAFHRRGRKTESNGSDRANGSAQSNR